MYVSTLRLQPGICLKTLFALLLAASASACHCRDARTHPDKQRLIVTTDLGGTDPDDMFQCYRHRRVGQLAGLVGHAGQGGPNP